MQTVIPLLNSSRQMLNLLNMILHLLQWFQGSFSMTAENKVSIKNIVPTKKAENHCCEVFII